MTGNVSSEPAERHRRRIVFVGPSHLAGNPRLVRSANALAKAGYEVVAVTPAISKRKADLDAEMAADGHWRHVPVPLYRPNGDGLGLRHRLMWRLSNVFLGAIPMAARGSYALVYGAGGLRRVAGLLRGDLYIGQQHSCLPLVGTIAKAQGVPFGCDIEDILSECSDEPRALIRRIEQKYLGDASFVLTMSDAAREHLCELHGGAERIVTVHNCPSLFERGRLVRPSERIVPDRPIIYWFGQTLGPHSCAIALLEANVRAGFPFQLRFRGKAQPAYLEQLNAVARRIGASGSYECLPLADPREMVMEAGACDVLFGSQPSSELFHQLAIGNKVFTGLLSGCLLLLSDTIAHRRMQRDLGDAAEVVDHNDPEGFARTLRALAEDRDRLMRRRESAWDLGTMRFHWEKECSALVDRVNRMFCKKR